MSQPCQLIPTTNPNYSSYLATTTNAIRAPSPEVGGKWFANGTSVCSMTGITDGKQKAGWCVDVTNPNINFPAIACQTINGRTVCFQSDSDQDALQQCQQWTGSSAVSSDPNGPWPPAFSTLPR
jgi:hypothetical protein